MWIPRPLDLRYVLAQPPDITETFVQEVDENLRRDRVRDFFKQNGSWLIAALILFLAVCGGIHLVPAASAEPHRGRGRAARQIDKEIGVATAQRRRSSSTNSQRAEARACARPLFHASRAGAAAEQQQAGH